MKDGYFYFVPASAGKTDIDKSLGYLCITKCPKRASYSIQCSLGQEIAVKLGCHGEIEIYLSSDTYTNAQSILIGKICLSQNTRLFVDSSITTAAADSVSPSQYVIVTTCGRTICYAVLEKGEQPLPEPEPKAAAQPQEQPHNQSAVSVSVASPKEQPAVSKVPFRGKGFDPFDTTNPAYKWYIYDNCTDGPDSVRNIQELDKMLRYFNVQYDTFAKLGAAGAIAPYSDTFLKMSHYAVQVAGHVLRGEYCDPESGRKFTIIGLPGWNTQNPSNYSGNRHNSRRRGRNPQQQTASGNTKSIRECSRWLAAKRKPPCSYNRNYNGYWLYYFDAQTGIPVKAIMKNN